ncbi:MAG: hypothetical protein AABW79_00360 [Nanoarchaeota archaeon]
MGEYAFKELREKVSQRLGQEEARNLLRKWTTRANTNYRLKSKLEKPKEAPLRLIARTDYVKRDVLVSYSLWLADTRVHALDSLVSE